MYRYRLNALCLLLLVVAGSLAGCGDSQSFMAIEARDALIADFDDFELRGQERLVFTARVEADMRHPHFEGRWTNLNKETDVDLYIIPAESYDAAVPLTDLEQVAWSSAPLDGVIFGERRPTTVEFHPGVGNWVLVFFNPSDDTPTTVAEVSATVRTTFFR